MATFQVTIEDDRVDEFEDTQEGRLAFMSDIITSGNLDGARSVTIREVSAPVPVTAAPIDKPRLVG